MELLIADCQLPIFKYLPARQIGNRQWAIGN